MNLFSLNLYNLLHTNKSLQRSEVRKSKAKPRNCTVWDNIKSTIWLEQEIIREEIREL